MPWGDRVQKRRDALGLTQAELANLCQPLTQQTISRIENSTLIPRDTTKRTIAEKLATTVDDLFPWEDFDETERIARAFRNDPKARVRMRQQRRSA
jgi:DNA-binding XRE family transcriptional regulator